LPIGVDQCRPESLFHPRYPYVAAAMFMCRGMVLAWRGDSERIGDDYAFSGFWADPFRLSQQKKYSKEKSMGMRQAAGVAYPASTPHVATRPINL
jgi:hypothetical protein